MSFMGWWLTLCADNFLHWTSQLKRVLLAQDGLLDVYVEHILRKTPRLGRRYYRIGGLLWPLCLSVVCCYAHSEQTMKIRLTNNKSIQEPICTRGTAKAKVNDPCRNMSQRSAPAISSWMSPSCFQPFEVRSATVPYTEGSYAGKALDP